VIRKKSKKAKRGYTELDIIPMVKEWTLEEGENQMVFRARIAAQNPGLNPSLILDTFAAEHPEHIDRLILYAPILSGIGAYDVPDAFHHNTWEHAASDFQMTEDGAYDLSVTDPVIIEEFCSSCWHHDGESSPNGGRRDICVPQNELLIDLKAISVPTLLIHGDADPYLNYELLEGALDELPDGSDHVVIHGGSHVVMIEAPYYHEFQGAVAGFLGGDVNA
jgi:pimeloyl-ACP methyl ester carboxylesterase